MCSQFLITDGRQRIRHRQRRFGQRHRERLAFHHDFGQNVLGQRRRKAHIVGLGAQHIAPWCPSLNQDVGTVAGRQHQTFGGVGRKGFGVTAGARVQCNQMQIVPFQRQMKVIRNAGIDQPPALDLARTQHQGGTTYAIDQERWLCTRVGHLGEALQLPFGIKNRRLEHHDAVTGSGNLGHIIQRARDHNGTSHATGHLHCGRTVQVGVVPRGARRVIVHDRIFVLARLSRLHGRLGRVDHIVAIEVLTHHSRRHMQTMGVQISTVHVAQMLHRLHAGRIGRQIIDHANAQGLSCTHLQRGRRYHGVVGA